MMSGVPVDSIPDEHPEVLAFAGLSDSELTHRLWAGATKEKIATFCEAIGVGHSFCCWCCWCCCAAVLHED